MTQILFDPNPFKDTLEKMREHLLGHEDPVYRARQMAVAAHLPVLAVLSYLLRPEMIDSLTPTQVKETCMAIQGNLDFYSYDAVKAWDDLTPTPHPV